MPITLAQANELSQDFMVKGIYEELIKASPLMSLMQFVDVIGTGYTVNREDEDNPPAIQVHQPNDIWTESVGRTKSKTYALTILGGDCDVDHFLQQTRRDKNDLMAEQISMKTKAMAHTFDRLSVYGASASGEFPGFHELVNDAGSSMQLDLGSGTTGAPLSLLQLDEAIDMCTAGTPAFILMNKRIARELTSYLRTVGSYQTERDDYGNRFTIYNDIPIVTTDWLYQTEALSSGAYNAATGGATSSIFIGYIGGDGVMGIRSGDVQWEKFDNLETKDASRTRIKWYVSLAQHSTKSLVRVSGVTAAAVTARPA